MGYKLYRDVKQYAPDCLTAREKLTAMVLADDARDDTRMSWNSAYNAELMRQAKVPDERTMRRVLAKLIDAKVIERVNGGHNGKVAKFRFLHLGPAEAAGDDDTMGKEAPAVVESHPISDATAEPGSVGGAISPSYAPALEAKGGGNHPPSAGVGGSISPGRGVEITRPTPQTPQNISSSSAPHGAPMEAPEPRVGHHEDEEEMINKGEETQTLHQRAAEHVAERLGYPQAVAEQAVHRILNGRNLRGTPLGYIKGIPDSDLRDYLEQVTSQQVETEENALQVKAIRAFYADLERAKRSHPTPVCEHGEVLGKRLNPKTGNPHCPQCRRAAQTDGHQPPRMVMLNGGRSGRPREDSPDPVSLAETGMEVFKSTRARMEARRAQTKTRTA